MTTTAGVRRAAGALLLIMAVLVGVVPALTGGSTAAAVPARTHQVRALLIPIDEIRTGIRPEQVQAVADDLDRWLGSASDHRLRLTTKAVRSGGNTTCARTTAKALEQLRSRGTDVRRYDVVMVITERRCRSISGPDASTLRRGRPDVITAFGVDPGFRTLDNASTPLARRLREVVPGGDRLKLPTPTAAPRVSPAASGGLVGARWSRSGREAFPIRSYEYEVRSSAGTVLRSHLGAARAVSRRMRSADPVTIRVRSRSSFGPSVWTSVRVRALPLPSTLTVVSPTSPTPVTTRYLDVTLDVTPHPAWSVPITEVTVADRDLRFAARKVSAKRWVARVDLAVLAWGHSVCLTATATDAAGGRSAPGHACVTLPFRYSAPTIVTPTPGAELPLKEPLVVRVAPGLDRLTGAPAPRVAVTLDGANQRYATAETGWTVTFFPRSLDPAVDHEVVAWSAASEWWPQSVETGRTLTLTAPASE